MWLENLAMETTIASTQTGPNKSSLAALLISGSPGRTVAEVVQAADSRFLGDLRPYRDVSARIRLVVNSQMFVLSPLLGKEG
jgi:hypothetical protein